MAASTNDLVSVQLYNDPMLALIQESCVYLNTANEIMNDVVGNPYQLGATWKYKVPFDAIVERGLTANFQNTNQNFRVMSIDRYYNASYAFTMSEYEFNAKKFMKDYGEVHAAAIGTQIEADIGALAIEQAYRYYGDGRTPITNFPAIARAITQLGMRGSAGTQAYKAYISNQANDDIVTSGVNQFAPGRNDPMVKNWLVGNYKNTDFYRTNLLPVHRSGNLGNADAVLTVTGFTQDANGGVTTITFSGAGTDVDAIKMHDRATFQDNVGSLPNVRFVSKYGHIPVAAPVQFRVTADAPSSGGSVTVSIYPALQATAGLTQNISSPIQVGMQVVFLPDFQAGMITMGNALYLSMPPLPPQSPFTSVTTKDDKSGVTFQSTYGAVFNTGQLGMIHRVWAGWDLVPDYAITLIFKADQ